MNSTIKAIVIITLLFSVNFGYSQAKLKFGHINSNELIALMPERTKAQTELQEYASQLEEQLTVMQTELENKYNVYLKQESTYNDIVKETKQQELQDLQTRIQEFQGSAQTRYQKKESELIQPIIDKANNAIQVVGKENGFTYIFDVGAGAVVYFSENSIDILSLVKANLGIVE